MKIIQQARLFLQQGTSDKVYEVDLCEVGTNEYVVNFRYGKRGAQLREGTKTVFPVPLAEAEKVFTKLVNEKTSKGYQAIGNSQAPEIGKAQDTDTSAQKSTILSYLEKAAQGSYDESSWPLSRVVWRAGEMRWPEAEAHLRAIPLRNEALFDYSLAWALGRCGSAESAEKLRKLQQQATPTVSRIATEALSLIGSEADHQQLVQQTLEQLPESIREPIVNQQPDTLAKKLSELLIELKVEETSFLSLLPRVSDQYPFVMEVLCELLPLIPFRPNYFHQVRYLLKAAELRDDTRLYGTITARIDKTDEYFKIPHWGDYAYLDGEYINNLREEFAKERPRVAYSQKTRQYLQRRSLRWLTRMGDAKSSQYTNYARDILLNFSDADARGAEKRTEYSYEYVNDRWNSRRTDTYFADYSVYPILGFLLYQNSPRYTLAKAAGRWRCTPPYQPSEPAPAVREEAFPNLWDEAPEALVTLLQQSHCRIVNEFAIKAFRANPHRDEYVTPTLITELLNQAYSESHQLGLELTESVYDAKNPYQELVLALLTCPLAEAQALGMRWVDDQPKAFVTHSSFVIGLLRTEQEAVHIWARNLLTQHQVEPAQAAAIVQEVVQHLLQLQPPADEEQLATTNAYAARVSDSLLLVFPDAFATVDEAIWQPLLAHPLEPLPLLAGKILLRQNNAQALSDTIFEAFITSPFASVRGVGVELFGQLPDAVLIERKDVLTSFCLSAHPEIRQQVQPVIGRLLKNHPAFGRELVELLLPLLWRKETQEGIHQDLERLFRQQLSDYFQHISSDQIWKLIDADYREAHLLGAQLLKQQVDLEQVALEQIVALGSHEMLELREVAHNYFQKNVPRIRYEREKALKLLDASWEDSRQFAMRFFAEQFRQEDWTPELLVSVCDRVRPEIQQFGLQQITQHFQEANGIEYMLKLSQHPNTQLQLFVTNYLTRYAAGNPERLQKMDYYFTSVLSQVNRGSVAKQRAFTFLGEEAQKDEAVAAWVLPLLTRVSPTIAITDKARCIQLMHQLKMQYPSLESPITVVEPETV